MTTVFLDTSYKIIQSRLGGRVERCHGISHQGSYNNAAHSWGVAMLMHYIFPEDFQRLALVCIAHDVPEGYVGDIPSPVLNTVTALRRNLSNLEGALNKRIDLPAENELSEEDHIKLKVCDTLEFYLWCREEAARGNEFVGESLANVVSVITKRFHEGKFPKFAFDVFQQLEINYIVPERLGVLRDTYRKLGEEKNDG